MATKHPTLAAALIAAQQAFSDITKDRKVDVRTQKGQYSYTYADLGSVLDSVTPALHDNGLVLSQPLDMVDGQPVIRTVLMHADSGDTLEGRTLVVWADKTDPQKFGGGITYSRRYAIMAILNLNAEDDDGQHARQPREQTNRDTGEIYAPRNEGTPVTMETHPYNPPRQWVPDASDRSARNETTNPNGPSEAQLRRLFAMQKQLGMTDEDVHSELYVAYGIASRKELTRPQYAEYTDKLDAQIKGAKNGSTPDDPF